jgi:hypothetical protein
MFAPSTIADISLQPGVVVAPTADLMGVQSPGGYVVPTDKLGPGIVQQLAEDGRVCVRWVGAGFVACLDPQDVRSLGGHAHLLTIYKRDRNGARTFLRYKVAASAGLEHNWTVELLPGNVVRVMRPDGLAWTFTVSSFFKRINAWWPQPPEDDDAEAFTAAELGAFG